MNRSSKNKFISNGLKIGILLFLSVPLIFQLFRIKEFTPLNGVQTSKSQSIFDSLKGNLNFSDRSYQSFVESKLDENLVVKSPYVRLRNQLEYSLFNKINAQQIYQYQDQLFRFYDPNYNEGSLYLGESVIEEKVFKLKELQKSIGEEHPIITVIAPSKTYFYSELLPKINSVQTEKSNYKKIKKALIANHLNVIDFNQWFLKIKNKKEAPLFGKGGIHWTLYGATLAMDSVVTFIENIHQKSFQHPIWRLKKEYEFFYNDQDLAQLLNVFKAPNDISLRNPSFHKIHHSKKKIKALVISDSFFDVISISELRDQIFTVDTDYLYYFNTRKDPTNNNQIIDKSSLLSKMKQCDCIFIMNDIVNMENFGWGFIETAFDQIKSETIKDLSGHKRK